MSSSTRIACNTSFNKARHLTKYTTHLLWIVPPLSGQDLSVDPLQGDLWILGLDWREKDMLP